MAWILETFGPVVDSEIDEFDGVMLARLKDIRLKVELYGP